MSAENDATAEPHTNGNPTWTTSFLAAVARGVRPWEAATSAGTSRSAIYRHVNDDAAFAEQFRNAKQRAAVKALGKKWLEGKDLPAAGLDVAPGTLLGWHHEGCPLLGGKRLKAKLHPLDRNRLVYWRRHVEAIVAALEPLPDEFEENGYKWLWCQVAANRFGMGVQTMVDHHRCGRLERRDRTGTSNGRNVGERAYFRVDQLETLCGERLNAKESPRLSTQPFREGRERWCPASWCETKEAADEGLDFPPYLLIEWSNEKGKCPWLMGKRLVPREEWSTGADGILREVRFFRESDLRKIKDTQANPPNRDLVGLSEAKKEYRLTQTQLDLYRRKPNPRLGNRKLNPVTAWLLTDVSRTVTLKRRRAYPRADLEKLSARAHVVRPDPGKWINRMEAAAEAGVGHGDIKRWRREGHPGPNGTKLYLNGEKTFTIETGGPHGTRLMDVVYFSRASFEAIMEFRKRHQTWDALHVDAKGSCYYLAYVKRTLGPRNYLKPCPALGLVNGRPRKTARRRIDRPVGAGGQPRVWGYDKDDVDTAETALKLANGTRHR